jgi:hypothetical protein
MHLQKKQKQEPHKKENKVFSKNTSSNFVHLIQKEKRFIITKKYVFKNNNH